MDDVKKMIEYYSELKNFKLRIKIYECLEKDYNRKYNIPKTYLFNEHINGNDENVYINIFEDKITYDSNIIPMPFREKQRRNNNHIEMNHEMKIIEALDNITTSSRN